MQIIQNYTMKKNIVKKNFAAGDGVASRDQESVRPSADDLECRLPDSPMRGVVDSPTRQLTHTGSRRLTVSSMWGVDDSPIWGAFFKNSIADSRRLSESLSWGVDFRLRLSPRIGSQNRNISKGSARDLCWPELCENIEKFCSLPCPFNNCLRREQHIQRRLSSEDREKPVTVRLCQAKQQADSSLKGCIAPEKGCHVRRVSRLQISAATL